MKIDTTYENEQYVQNEQAVQYTQYTGIIPPQKPTNKPFIVKTIVILCIITFVLQFMIPYFTEQLWLEPIELFNHPWQPVTSLFLHGGITHLLFNMVILWMFGNLLEREVGPKSFLAIFIISGIIGNIGSIMIGDPTIPSLGASGAIYGIIGALAILKPNMKVYVFFIPMKIPFAAIVYAAIEIFSMGNADGIGHAAHLMGLIGGVIIAKSNK